MKMPRTESSLQGVQNVRTKRVKKKSRRDFIENVENKRFPETRNRPEIYSVRNAHLSDSTCIPVRLYEIK